MCGSKVSLSKLTLLGRPSRHCRQCKSRVWTAVSATFAVMFCGMVGTAAPLPIASASDPIGQALLSDLQSADSVVQDAAIRRLDVIFDEISTKIVIRAEARDRIGPPLNRKMVKLMQKYQSPQAAQLCVKAIDYVDGEGALVRLSELEPYCCAETLVSYGASGIPYIYSHLRSIPPEFLSDEKVILVSIVLREVFGKEIVDDEDRIGELLRSLEKQAILKNLSPGSDRNFRRVIDAVKAKKGLRDIRK